MIKNFSDKSLSIIKHKSDPDIVGKPNMEPQRREDKKSTIYLSQNAFFRKTVKSTRFESFDTKPNTLHSPTISYMDLPYLLTTTNKHTPTKSFELQTPVVATFAELPTNSLNNSRKGIRIDPLFLQRKQTFSTDLKQNVFHLCTLLKKASQKSEEPKAVKQKSKKFEKIEMTRKNEFNKFVSATKTRGETFVKFAFKSHEKADNHCIDKYMQEISTSTQKTLGSMTVCDLWSNKQLCKYLKSSNLNNDKLMFQKLNKIMIKDRKDKDQKELTKQKQIFNVFKDENNQQEHLGKNIYFPKKRYQQQIQGKQVHANSNEKITELVNKIDEIHDDNLYLYQNMTNVLDKLQGRDKFLHQNMTNIMDRMQIKQRKK